MAFVIQKEEAYMFFGLLLLFVSVYQGLRTFKFRKFKQSSFFSLTKNAFVSLSSEMWEARNKAHQAKREYTLGEFDDIKLALDKLTNVQIEMFRLEHRKPSVFGIDDYYKRLHAVSLEIKSISPGVYNPKRTAS